ncbi:glycosyltransferase [Enterocloster aldenensis]|uniref:glycosyltransferase n=1 Tax=Enterocloster aldenensis TaxID=358742 RepID=UPI000E487FA4|nr:glycosyltransferase [Enterocloster aldenensis]
MDTYKVVAALVIYNRRIEESITYRNIKEFLNINIDLLVVDNSEIKTDNILFCKKNNIRYISMNGNKGLSKAYNIAVDANLDRDVIILLDDDTEISEEYFTELFDGIIKHPDVDIFAPFIYGQDGVLYSPNEFHFLKNHLISSPNQDIKQENFNAIASCLAIRMRVFDNYRFNEILFVDQVDQYFFCEQRKRGKKFEKLNVKITQNFYQRGNVLTPKAGWQRLKLRIIDIMRHARLMNNVKYILLGYIKCCGLGIQIGRKSKSIKTFLKAFFLSTKLLIYPQ